MTEPSYSTPSRDAGSTLPTDARDYQDLINAITGSVMHRAAIKLTVTGTATLTAVSSVSPSGAGPGLPEMRTGNEFWWIAPNDCTGPTNISIDGHPAVDVRDKMAAPLASGAWAAGDLVQAKYDGTYLRLSGNYNLAAGAASSGMAPGFVSGFAVATAAGDPDNDIIVNKGYARSEDNTLDIVLASALTKRMDVAWAQGHNQGGILQSVNLTGAASVTNGTPNITGNVGCQFLTDFVVGDVLQTAGGQARRIVTITDDQHMTAESNFTADELNVTYKRGGKAPNTCYRVLAIRNDAAGDVDAALSSRDVPADLPAGWSAYARVAYWLTDATGNNRRADQFGVLTMLRTAITVASDAYTTTAAHASPQVSISTIQTPFPPGVRAWAHVELEREVNNHGTGMLIVFPAVQTTPAGDIGKLYIADDGTIDPIPVEIRGTDIEVPLSSTSTFKYQFTRDRGSAGSSDWNVRIYFYGWVDNRGAGVGGIGSDPLAESVVWPGVVSPASITADQHNYNPPDLAVASALRLTSDADRVLTGLAGGAPGRFMFIENVGAYDLTLRHRDKNSSATRRFDNGTLGDLVLQAGDAATYKYDGTTQRWRLQSSTAQASDGYIAVGETPRGLVLQQSPDEEAMVAVEPIAGPQILRGKYGRGQPHIIILTSQSNIASDVPVRKPVLTNASRLLDRVHMFEACGLTGLGTTDITTLDLRKIVSARDAVYQTQILPAMAEICRYEDEHDMRPSDWLIINSARGGTTSDLWMPGQPMYDNQLAGVEAARKYFSREADVSVVMGDGGEADAGAGTAYATIQSRYQTIYDQSNIDFPGITGQTTPVNFVWCQTPMILSNPGVRDVQKLQLDLHIAALAGGRRFFASGGRDDVPYPDLTHLSPWGCIPAGARLGVAAATAMWGGLDDFEAFWATSATADGSEIVIGDNCRFTRQFLTDWWPAEAGLGFTARATADDSVQAQSASPYVQDAVIRVPMTTTVPTGGTWYIEYARTPNDGSGHGGRGNLRGITGAVCAIDGVTPRNQPMLATKLSVT